MVGLTGLHLMHRVSVNGIMCSVKGVPPRCLDRWEGEPCCEHQYATCWVWRFQLYSRDLARYGPKLVAAVSEAGGRKHQRRLRIGRERPGADSQRARDYPRPFAVNHVVPLLDDAAFQATLEAEPEVISFALGDPGKLVERAHDAGAKVIHRFTLWGKPARQLSWVWT